MKNFCKIGIVIVFCVIALWNNSQVFAAEELSVNAKAAFMVEVNTGKVIYENHAQEINYPASVTKILTAILVLENCELEEIATVSSNALANIPEGYVVAPLFVGEEMRVKDLLYALMLKSANDAAYVLAEHVGGSIDGFSAMMNQKAEELGCMNSHFVNPNGIHQEDHYTTAYDMYLIAQYAMQNAQFVQIVSTYQYTLPATNKYSEKDRVMENTNSFVNPESKYYDTNVKGIKTGTTTQAGNCLIVDAEKNGFEIITVVLGAETKESKFLETSKMMQYMFDNYTFTEIHKTGDMIQTIDVEKATKETKNLNIVISDDIVVMNHKDISVDEMQPEIVLKENIIAPIVKGQELGTIKYTVDGLEYEAKLLAGKNVEKKTYYAEITIGAGIVILIVASCVIIAIIKKETATE